jgi:multidrug resistance efflux pump
MSRRTLVILLIVVAAVAVGAFALGGGRTPGSDAAASPTLPPVPPSTSVVADAKAVPIRRAELSAPAGAGTVAEVLVAPGATVAADAPLVRFDSSLANADVASAQAALAGADAEADRATAAVAQAEAQVEAATASIEEAKAGVTAADAQRDGTPSGTRARRAANAEVSRAIAAVDAARAQRDAARRAVDVATAASAAATAEQARAKAAVVAAEATRDDLTVKAPFAGVVASIDARVGEDVAPGTIVARVADPSGWRFETTDLDETSVGRIVEGAAATVSLDAFPDTVIDARVASIAPFGTSSAGDIVYTIVLEPTGALPEGLRWNMTASATIDAPAAPS